MILLRYCDNIAIIMQQYCNNIEIIMQQYCNIPITTIATILKQYCDNAKKVSKYPKEIKKMYPPMLSSITCMTWVLCRYHRKQSNRQDIIDVAHRPSAVTALDIFIIIMDCHYHHHYHDHYHDY